LRRTGRSLYAGQYLFQKKTGVEIAYTGAFAAALGKSLLANATTDVFAGRVLDLAKKLRKSEVIPIPAQYFPPPPLTFTIGVMKAAESLFHF
jgi:molybdate transport system substrate-binding protein